MDLEKTTLLAENLKITTKKASERSYNFDN
jgi:hypothetical protein